MLPRNVREGTYCGRTSKMGTGSWQHVRSSTCRGHPPSTSGANLEIDCRIIRQLTRKGADVVELVRTLHSGTRVSG